MDYAFRNAVPLDYFSDEADQNIERSPNSLPSVLLVDPDGLVGEWLSGADARVLACVPPPSAPDHLRENCAPDIVWLTRAEAIDSDIVSAICAAAVARECGLVCETNLASLDRLAAVVPASLRAEWLVEADATDRLVALAAASRERRMRVHDVVRDEAMERIDRLQDEVARIARVLGELIDRRGLPGTPGGFATRGDGADGYEAALRSPPRDFAPGLRGFDPEERTIQRQRAKAVRRVLRQRRMREHYFPADLFADPAWDMLLDLYAARLEGQPVSVSSLCIAAAVPATTALRWIKTMTDAGLFLREADPHDGRRIFLTLSEGALDAMAGYFEALED